MCLHMLVWLHRSLAITALALQMARHQFAGSGFRVQDCILLLCLRSFQPRPADLQSIPKCITKCTNSPAFEVCRHWSPSHHTCQW
ncbi:hypothetical protein DEU56DRAFT_1131 [Suillus clintonianus]|uniref:uncharacterized protein n=1 Tax=Suillus clintonianus TaxID=1904413 RepID=UPI001B864ECE|nr:uncharacterized protein DEU56DRAFT_1131 [Suillus clintonianus]KAG2157011.1 hypothetical protein DEU56DRAFT_1131 [Suillus clintonianus]